MRHPHIVPHKECGLLIVDMQEKFKPAIPDFDNIVENVVRLILTFQMFKMPILVTEQYPQGLGNTVNVIRKQFDIFESIEKVAFSCLREEQFLKKFMPLKLNNLVVCGIESHVCINQTVLDLLQLGIKVHVVADAIGSRQKFSHEVAVQKMIQAGAIPGTTEMILFELAMRAGTQSFKNIQHMVKFSLKRTLMQEEEAEVVVAPGAGNANETSTESSDENPEAEAAHNGDQGVSEDIEKEFPSHEDEESGEEPLDEEITVAAGAEVAAEEENLPEEMNDDVNIETAEDAGEDAGADDLDLSGLGDDLGELTSDDGEPELVDTGDDTAGSDDTGSELDESLADLAVDEDNGEESGTEETEDPDLSAIDDLLSSDGEDIKI